MKRDAEGFTLIELMVVILIIGVLSGMVITVLKPQFFYGKGRDAQRKSDLQSVKASLQLYYLDNSRLYPNPGGSAQSAYNSLGSTLSDYLSGSLPTDPTNNSSYHYEYRYSSNPSNRKCFELRATSLESESGNVEVCAGSLSCQSANSFCQ